MLKTVSILKGPDIVILSGYHEPYLVILSYPFRLEKRN